MTFDNLEWQTVEGKIPRVIENTTIVTQDNTTIS